MDILMEKIRPYQKLSAGTLKLIAVVTMLIDHFAAGVYVYLYNSGYLFERGMAEHTVTIYTVLRNIGRFAFPIFCFLLVEGFFYTRSRWKYLRNLVIFGLVSEVPFDLLLMGGIGLRGQNVFFTLVLGFGAVWLVETVRNKFNEKWFLSMLIQFVIAGGACLMAELLHTDYSYNGVCLILIFYFFRQQRLLACVIGYLLFTFEPWCFTAFVAILFYSGNRGISLKYFFYAFYPAHLLLLYGLRLLLIGK